MSHGRAFEDAASGIRIVEKAGYLTIEQDGRHYAARRWKLTSEVENLVRTAVAHGFNKLWQDGRPQGAESSYISFSRTHDKHSWIFSIGLEAGPPALSRVTFNKRFETIFDDVGVDWIRQKHGGRNLLIALQDFEKVLKAIHGQP